MYFFIIGMLLSNARECCGFMLLTVDELFAKDGVTLEANQAYWRCLDGVTTQY